MTEIDAGEDEQSRIHRYGPFAIAVVTISLVTWPIAFNLGAYGVVFYQDVFAFLVAATAGLAVSFLTPPYQGSRLWTTRVLLAGPALWFVFAVVFFPSIAEAAASAWFGVFGLVVAATSLPTVLLMLKDLFAPGLNTIESRPRIGAAILSIALIALAGFLVGRNNDVFLVCNDFKVAGSDVPDNCDPG